MSLKSIAQKVGVSPSTVSRVLNDNSPTCASRELKDRIWQAAKEEGYTPNQSARTLRTGSKNRQSRVTVVMTRPNALEEDPFFYELCRCVDIELCAAGCEAGEMVCAEGLSADDLANKLSGSDGVVIVGRCPENLSRSIKKVTGNIVAVSRNPRDFDMDEVVCDGERAAELAMNHLLDLGHRKIAYIGECTNEDRYVGYCESLIRHNLHMDYDIIVPCEPSLSDGRDAMEKLLARGSFTAVFCANDIIALGAMEALKIRGREVQGKISVISIDDIEQGRRQSPMLTTVSVPLRDMAHSAVMLLLDRIKGGHKTSMRVELPCALIKRESCFTQKR
ncbi:MAG: LacI family DNA-binding transcriptional regulator [Oscillospiraceae bacterium]|nr:LacI family DNA-binding transcriptional regulator [Oscillospiraceae bacterium]